MSRQDRTRQFCKSIMHVVMINTYHKWSSNSVLNRNRTYILQHDGWMATKLYSFRTGQLGTSQTDTTTPHV